MRKFLLATVFAVLSVPASAQAPFSGTMQSWTTPLRPSQPPQFAAGWNTTLQALDFNIGYPAAPNWAQIPMVIGGSFNIPAAVTLQSLGVTGAASLTGGGTLGGSFGGSPTLSGAPTFTGAVRVAGGGTLSVNAGYLYINYGTQLLIDSQSQLNATSTNRTQWPAISDGGNLALSSTVTHPYANFAFNLSGTSASGASSEYFNISTSTDTANLTANDFMLANISRQFGGTGTEGGRISLNVANILTASTSDPNGVAVFQQAINIDSEMRGNMGGTSSVPTGNVFGAAIYARLETGATYYVENTGLDIGISLQSGTSVEYARGVDIQVLGDTAVAPSGEFQGYTMGAESATAGVNQITVAYAIGRADSYNPLASTAAVMLFEKGLTTGTVTIAKGIDLSALTFTGNSWNDGHISFTGAGHIASTGTAPAVSACGTSPIIASGSTDTKGAVTEGTTATGCTITFATAYATAPMCVISSPDGILPTGYSASTTALTITNASASGDEFDYQCMQ